MDEIKISSSTPLTGISKTFSYNGNKVRMKMVGMAIFVCLTDMAKNFPNKNLSNIINSKELVDYIARMTEIQNCSSTDLLKVTKGGDASAQGTWAHRRIALRVAQKLSPEFAIWVDEKIEELLTQGVTTINDEDATILHAMQVLQKRVEEKQRALQSAQATISTQNKLLQKQAPKVEYYDTVL